MLTKRLVIGAMTGIAIIGLFFLFIQIEAFWALNSLQNTPHATLKETLDDPEQVELLHLNQAASPIELGFPSAEEFSLSARGTRLSGWYVPPAKDNSQVAILFAHDIGQNRLALLNLLAATRETGQSSSFHFFLPDLGGSGPSESHSHLFGYGYAEDLILCMVALQQEKNIQSFILFGVGAGGMGALLALAHPQYQATLRQRGIQINGLILESPISNTEGYLRQELASRSEYVQSAAVWQFNQRVDGNLPLMQIRALAELPPLPVLILQNIGDQQTTTDLLLVETQQLPSANEKSTPIQVELFDGEEHGRICLHPTYRRRYIELLAQFLKSF